MDKKQMYENYLNSFEWRKKRELVLERDLHRCVLCDSPKHLRIHHRRYPEVLGEEPLSDLYTICNLCHDLFHKYSFLEQQKEEGRKQREEQELIKKACVLLYGKEMKSSRKFRLRHTSIAKEITGRKVSRKEALSIIQNYVEEQKTR